MLNILLQCVSGLNVWFFHATRVCVSVWGQSVCECMGPECVCVCVGPSVCVSVWDLKTPAVYTSPSSYRFSSAALTLVAQCRMAFLRLCLQC